MTRYETGRRLEYKIKKYLEGKGYLVVRSSGSHGAADLVAIQPGIDRMIGDTYVPLANVLLIQCKAKKMSRNMRNKIKLTLLKYEGLHNVKAFVLDTEFKKEI